MWDTQLNAIEVNDGMGYSGGTLVAFIPRCTDNTRRPPFFFPLPMRSYSAYPAACGSSMIRHTSADEQNDVEASVTSPSCIPAFTRVERPDMGLRWEVFIFQSLLTFFGRVQ